MDLDSAKIILEKLVNGKHATCASLASTLSLSESSVNRCIRALRKSGFPIVYSRREKTFFLSEEYLGTKSNTEVFERIALELAKILFGEGPLTDAISRIENQLKAEPVKNHLQAAIVDTKDINIRYINLLEDVGTAITQRRLLIFSYEPVGKKFHVEPIYVFIYKGVWYLRGYNTEKWTLMNFALRRISSLEVSKLNFLARVKDITDDLQSAIDLIDNSVTQ